MINREKSVLLPNNIREFLGFVLNSINLTLELPDTERKKILALIGRFKIKKTCKIREFA